MDVHTTLCYTMATRGCWLLCVALHLLVPWIQCESPLSIASAAVVTREFRQNSVRMLNDLVRHESTPTSLFLLACWTPTENVALVKSFNGMVTIMHPAADKSPKLPDDVYENLVMFVVDTSCKWQLNKVNATYFRFPYRWVVLNPSENTLDSRMWNDVPIWMDSHLTLATWNHESKSFRLDELYKLGEVMNDVILELFGEWSSVSSNRIKDLRETRIISRRRRDLRQLPFQTSVVILDNDTLNHLWDYKDRHVDSCTKHNFILINALMDIMNVNRTIKYVDTWGYFDPKTNEINGMLGDLKSGESVLGGTALFLMEYRVPFFDYVSMVTPSRTKFIFRAPPLSFVSNIYYLPFQGMVWVCTAAMVCISCVAIYVAYWGSEKNGYSEADPVRGTDVVLLGVGAIAQMGSTIEAKFLSAKISTIFFFIFMLFIYTSYTANIVSLLQATTKSIRTLEDLYKSNMEYGVHDVPYNRWYFPNVVGKIRQDIYHNKIAPKNKPDKYVNYTYGMENMRKGFYTMFIELGSAYKTVEETFYEHEKCGIIEIDYLGVEYPWMIMEKRTRLKEIIKINLFRLREHGVQMREFHRVYTNKPICTAGGQSFQSVRLVDCYMVLQVLGCGCAGALFVLALEMLIHKRSKRLGALCLF